MKYGVIDYISKSSDPVSLKNKVESAIKYSTIQRQKIAPEDPQNVLLSHQSAKTIITLRNKFDAEKIIDETKNVCTAEAMESLQFSELIIDIRYLLSFNSNDIPILKAITDLFPKKEIFLITGKYFNRIKQDKIFPDRVKIFISYGDMEMYAYTGSKEYLR